MQLPKDAVLLRIFFGEADKSGGKPLYEAIVLEARELHMAGATVFRGLQGFGAHSRMHTAKILRLSQDLPIVIEIVDTKEKIDGFLELVDAVVQEGIATLEEVHIHFYRAGKQDVPAPES